MYICICHSSKDTIFQNFTETPQKKNLNNSNHRHNSNISMYEWVSKHERGRLDMNKKGTIAF